MGRPAGTAGGRPVVVATRLAEVEAWDLDEVRGALTRAEYLRWLLAQDRRRRGKA